MNGQHDKRLPGSPQEWLNHAASDLALANLGAGAEDVLPEQICFHCQQTVEKTLKAVLLHNKISFPLTHDIETLLELAEEQKILLPSWADEMTLLTPYAVETRYPGHWDILQETDIQDALIIAKHALQWAMSIVGTLRS